MAPSRNQISIGKAVNFAWSSYWKRWRLFAGVLIAMLGAWVALEVVVFTTQRLGIIAWTLEHIAFLLCFAGIEVGLLRISLALDEGRDPRLADAFNNFNLAPAFLAGQLLYLTMVLAGLALLVVPGILLAARFALIGFQNAAGESVIRSFRHSWSVTRGTTGRLVATLVALFGFNLLGAALLGVGLFITVPISVLLMASINRQLSRRFSVV